MIYSQDDFHKDKQLFIFWGEHSLCFCSQTKCVAPKPERFFIIRSQINQISAQRECFYPFRSRTDRNDREDKVEMPDQVGHNGKALGQDENYFCVSSLARVKSSGVVILMLNFSPGMTSIGMPRRSTTEASSVKAVSYGWA